MELDNGMTRFVAGSEDDIFINRTPVGECRRDLLQLAKRNIGDHFAFVGTTESFDRSLVCLSRVLGWPTTYYFSRNLAVKKPGASNEALPESLISELEERNSLDRELYEFGVDRLNADCARFEVDQHDIDSFKASNALRQKRIGPLYDAYSRFKHIFKRDTPH